MITQQHLDTQQLGERYLADQLSEAERTEFEQYYSEHPQALQDLQAVASIKLGLALLRESGELNKLTASPRNPWQGRWLLAAALLIAALGSTYLLQMQFKTARVLPSSAALTRRPGPNLPILLSYEVERTRSDADVVITKPATNGLIALSLRDAFAPSPARYRLELRMISDSRPLRAALGGVAAEDGQLNVYLNPAALAPGNYELRVSEESSGTHAGEFLIDIVGTGDPAARDGATRSAPSR